MLKPINKGFLVVCFYAASLVALGLFSNINNIMTARHGDATGLTLSSFFALPPAVLAQTTPDLNCTDPNTGDPAGYQCNSHADGTGDNDTCFSCYSESAEVLGSAADECEEVDADDDGTYDACDYPCDDDGDGVNDDIYNCDCDGTECCCGCDTDDDGIKDTAFMYDLDDSVEGNDSCYPCDNDQDGTYSDDYPNAPDDVDSSDTGCDDEECYSYDVFADDGTPGADGVLDTCHPCRTGNSMNTLYSEDYQCMSADDVTEEDICYPCDLRNDFNDYVTDGTKDSCYNQDLTNTGHLDWSCCEPPNHVSKKYEWGLFYHCDPYDNDSDGCGQCQYDLDCGGSLKCCGSGDNATCYDPAVSHCNSDQNNNAAIVDPDAWRCGSVESGTELTCGSGATAAEYLTAAEAAKPGKVTKVVNKLINILKSVCIQSGTCADCTVDAMIKPSTSGGVSVAAYIRPNN